VSSGSGPVRLLSERDLVTVAATGDDLAAVQAGQAMTADLAWAAPESTIRDVGLLMRDAGVRHVPIGDGVDARRAGRPVDVGRSIPAGAAAQFVERIEGEVCRNGHGLGQRSSSTRASGPGK